MSSCSLWRSFSLSLESLLFAALAEEEEEPKILLSQPDCCTEEEEEAEAAAESFAALGGMYSTALIFLPLLLGQLSLMNFRVIAAGELEHC